MPSCVDAYEEGTNKNFPINDSLEDVTSEGFVLDRVKSIVRGPNGVRREKSPERKFFTVPNCTSKAVAQRADRRGEVKQSVEHILRRATVIRPRADDVCMVVVVRETDTAIEKESP